MLSLHMYSQDSCKRIRTCKYCNGATRATFIMSSSTVVETVLETGGVKYSRKTYTTYMCAGHAEHWAGELGVSWPVSAISFEKPVKKRKKPRAKRYQKRKAKINPATIETIFTKHRRKRV